MNVLLDECAPKKLKLFLAAQGHNSRTVQEEGWAGTGNGELLLLAEPRFDVLVTIDKGFQYQHHLTGRKMAIVIMRAGTNRLVDLQPLFPACAQTLLSIQPGQVVELTP